MNADGTGRRPYGVIGAFLVMLGAGVIFDADRTYSGSGLILAGVACLIAERRQATRD